MNQSPKKRQRTVIKTEVSSQQNLLQHLRASGALFPKLEFVNTTSSGITAFATDDIDVGEICFSLPAESIITTTVVNESTIGTSMLKLKHSKQSSSVNVEMISNEFLLCLYLIAAKRNVNHRFHHYAVSLSSKPPDPTNWPPDVQKQLCGTVASAVNKALSEIKSWYELCNAIDLVTPFNTNKPTIDELFWSRGHVVSRRFPEQLSSPISLSSSTDHSYSMLPGLDLMNHSNDANMEWDVDANDGTIRFRTLKQIKKGEECFNNYGPKSNTSLLFMHGFSLRNNPNDVVELSLKTKDVNGKISVLWEDKFYGNETSIPLSMLSNFIEDEGDDKKDVNGEDTIEISSDVIHYCLEYIQAQLRPLEVNQNEELKILLCEEDEKEEKVDPRLRWIAIHHQSQRKILIHLQSLLIKLLET
jgi:hypothetical protein